jgi:hypothetical protein
MRRLAFAAALAASWLLLLLWAAGVDWRSPWSPEQRRVFAGENFRAVFGTATVEGRGLHVEAPAQDDSALQTVAVDLEAADFPLLRYRFADFPRTLELSFVFRTAEQPDDVQTVTLPWPGRGESTFDLSRIGAWKGTVIELGFAQFATAQNVPPARGFAPFELQQARLWSRCWRGALGALATDWFAAWPWSQRSVHALGREGDAQPARPATLVAALAVVIAVGWAALLLGLRDRRLLAFAVGACALAWFALDLRWQVGLVQRLSLARTLYAGEDWPARQRIVGDEDIRAAADALRALLASEPSPRRVLVDGGTRYQSLRLIWHLLPLDTGELVLARASGERLPDGALIVFFDNPAWHADPAMRALLAHSVRDFGADTVQRSGFERTPLVVFRYRHGD